MVGFPLPAVAPVRLSGRTPMALPALLMNFLLSQVAWFGAVMGAARGLPWLGVIAVAAVVAWHLARARQPAREIGLLALALATGAVFETLLVQAGLLQFEQVDVYDITNGARFTTYVIYGEPGQVQINGAAARLVQPGDRVIVAAYAEFDADEVARHSGARSSRPWRRGSRSSSTAVCR